MNQALRFMLLPILITLLLLSAAYALQNAPAAETNLAASASELKLGEEVYRQVCNACHATGLAGAPKYGDKSAWAPRIAKGLDQLTASVVKGRGAMPARAGQAGLSDVKIRAAILYMVNASK